MERLWEIDFTRGIGIVMMLVSNFVTDLQYFYNYNVHETFWSVFARITAIVFLLIVGISLNLSYSRNNNFKRFAKRGIFIFILGLLITFATWFFMPENYVVFGILHLIGLSIIIGYPFLKLNKDYAFAFGAIFSVIGVLFEKLVASTNYLLWFGLTTANFSSVDYFPIFPWFGVVLLGIFIGKMLYPNGKRKFELPNFKFTKPISWLGRHSLIIYLIHQPILLGLLALLL